MTSFFASWMKSELFFKQLALGLVIAVSFLYGWSYIHMLWTPFVLGGSLAYILNMPVTFIHEKVGIPRWLTSGMLVGLIVLSAIMAVTLSLPFLQQQLTQLALSLPKYADLLALKLEPFMEHIDKVVHIKSDWPKYIGDLGRELVQFLILCLSNSMALANFFTLVVLTPIVTFYSLKDWPDWMARGDRLISSLFWRGLFKAVDSHLMAYLKGQAYVCGILMILYTLGILIIGVDGGWKLGVLIGCSAFVPYGAILVGFVGMALAAFQQMGTSAPLLEIFLMVGFLGAIEAYVLIPNFIGQRLGVHPVAVLFCFLMCVSTLGFVGVLIAMPLLAALWGGTKFIFQSFYTEPQPINQEAPVF